MDDPRTEAERLAEESALVAEHDQMGAALAAAVEAHKAAPTPDTHANRKAAMEAVANNRKHWREVGEYVGKRSGPVHVEDGV